MSDAHPARDESHAASRRAFLRRCAQAGACAAVPGLASARGAAALRGAFCGSPGPGGAQDPEPWRLPAAPAKSVIHLFMAGAPSQLELFDPKPELLRLDGQPLPPSFQGGRFAFLGPDAKLLGARRAFAQHGESGAWLSELLPHTAGVADELCFVKGMVSEEINHGPAKLFLNTGTALFGRPSMGAWVNWALGSEARDLPGFVVMTSGGRGPRGGAPLWGAGFLPSRFQATPLRAQGDPILHLTSPAGFEGERQQEFFDTVGALNAHRRDFTGDPETDARSEAYELARRMQDAAPALVDLSDESPATLERYGVDPDQPSFARNCLLARRLVERGVRFVQLYHTDWDHHGDPNNHLGEPLDRVCGQVDRASAALVADLRERGLLDQTIVWWGGEFGRTPMGEVRKVTGRDHHVDAFTVWLAGGGFRAGHSHGETDELGYRVVSGKMHVHDLQATLLHQLGIDHEKLTFRFQGRDFRLTDVAGHVERGILA